VRSEREQILQVFVLAILVSIGLSLLLASTKGEIDRLSAARRNAARPVLSVLFEPLLGKVRTRFGLADAGWNINAAGASSTLALARGAALIAHGKAEVVLVFLCIINGVWF
jgi:3-oxoacyl-[acyl-carrier-protein] synthase II